MNESGQWRVVGQSVRGASHERGNLPNQDAILWSPAGGRGLPLILSVADGHGGAKYFRSDVGARLAVETAIEVLRAFVDGHRDVENLSLLKRTAEEWLPKMLVRGWRESVEAHIGLNPLAAHESDSFENNFGASSSSRRKAQVDLPRAYGATLLAAAVTDAFILYVQLGDGDILCVADSGEVSAPLPTDERLFANETTSLCAEDAWRDFRVGFRPISNTPPALILLSTDGYPNSFRDETAFYKVGSDLLEIIRAQGIARVESELESWLSESTHAGSGDDVTLGVVCRMSADGETLAREVFEADESVEESVERASTPQREPVSARVKVEVGEGALYEPDA